MQYIHLVDGLIYGSLIPQNHRTWAQANVTPSGTAWLDHHVNAMLPAFESWMAANGSQPPLLAWDGTVTDPWPGDAGSSGLALATDLDGSFTGVGDRGQLSRALHQRLIDLGYGTSYGLAEDFSDRVKAPYSYRYWAYIKWAQIMGRKFNGEIVVPPAAVYDRDGTNLSTIPFFDVFNELHWRWHDFAGAHGFPAAVFPETTLQATTNTPDLDSPAGQRRYAAAGGLAGTGIGEEFFRFHRDHVGLYNKWLERVKLPAVIPQNMTDGWPLAPATAPATWVQPDKDPWINSENGDTDGNLRTTQTNLGSMGVGAGSISPTHGDGHNNNGDIAHPASNNYVPRFFAWHEWLDLQWWWRAPRFGNWDAAAQLRNEVFRPVLATGAAWPGLHAVTVVRDNVGAAADVAAPAGAVSGVNFSTGAGTLKMQFLVNDSYNRQIRLRLRAEVFNDPAAAAVETIPEATHTYLIGGAGQDFALNTEFTVDLAFANAFASDDPAGFGSANPVGFVNNRIRVTGTLEVADGSDPGFTVSKHTDVYLVREKEAPRIDLYFDLASFGEDQVATRLAASGGTEARFNNALIVTVQDRTTDSRNIVWPAEVHDEVKGLIRGLVAASGLFDDPAHRPGTQLAGAITGVTVEPASGPVKEDPALAENLPQRYTYFYDVVFAPGHTAFAGLALGASQSATLEVRTTDRSNNGAMAAGQLEFFREANPYMIDGATSWLSIDTRVFHLRDGAAKFNETLNASDPTAFIADVINRLNAGTAGADTFDGLPENQSQSALVFFDQVTDHGTGTTTPVRNFALAKVRLQGMNGATDVRAFFRLFRYTASNLIFDDNTGYRFHDAGGGVKVPKLGFSNPAAGDVVSIPFFATPRVGYTASMTTQGEDTPNVQNFPSGSSAEQVLYFGVYLDINQAGAQLPASYVAAHPDGGFGAAEVMPIRDIMYDHHQCMVVELKYDGDPTDAGATPASSDNLAQRNLVILKSDNPGGPLTHTVQHSFEVDTGKRRRGATEFFAAETATGFDARDEQRPELLPMPRLAMSFVNTDRRERQVLKAAAEMAFTRNNKMAARFDPEPYLDEARRVTEQKHPFAFDRARWSATNHLFDEVMFVWNDLPADSHVELYLPSINCEHVINLRHLRHAPDDVRIRDSHTLVLRPAGRTFIPIPPGLDGRVPGVLTIRLPAGIRKGQEWKVDVIQLRGGEQRTTGAFQVDIQVEIAEAIADDERQLLKLMHGRLSRLAPSHLWHPILRLRVDAVRARARALAEAAGREWIDPTVYVDPSGEPQPLSGERVRVVLEKIQVLDDCDPWIKGAGELHFVARVHTPDNGGQDQLTRIPEKGVVKISDKPGRNVAVFEQEIFRGFVADDLRIEVVGTEQDKYDPDDVVGKYTRVLCGPVSSLLGAYGPDDEKPIEPEDMLLWRLWYRVERA